MSNLIIPAGDTYALDGVTYTAINDAQLNLDDDGKVSGVASGSVSAVVTGRSNPVATVDATNSSTEFTLTGKGAVLTLTKVLPFELDNGTFTLAGNVLTAAKGSDLRIGTGRTYADGTIVFGHDYADTDITYTITDTTLTEETEKETIVFTASLGEQARSITTFVNGKIINGVADGKFTGGFTITKGSSMGLVLGNYTVKATANADATSRIFVDSKGINIIPGSGDGSLNVALSRGDTEIISGELNVTSGKITFGYDNAITFDKDTSFNLKYGDYVLSATTTDTATIGVTLTGNNIVFTPGQNDGGLNLLLHRGTTPVFAGVLNVTDGTITFDATTQKFSFSNGTNVSISLEDGAREIAFKVTGGNASCKVESDGAGNFVITPDNGDGSLDITLKSAGGSLSANIEVLSGSFILSEGGNITVTKGTELKIDFGDGYIINFKATDNAGGSLTLGANGITFAPNTQDGGLQLSVTRDGQTRTASLDVTGSVTYKLDGSISLAKGTVVKNVFDDGNILTITAKTAASGTITFNPQNGLTVTPATPKALNVSLTTGEVEVVNITSIDGTINYSGGIITANDGTKARISYSFGWELDLSTTGGTVSTQFTDEKAVYNANEGATVVLDGGESRFEFENGSCTDVYAENIGNGVLRISEGTTVRSNDDEFVFKLEKAGDYNLNGNAITTTKDGVEVMLANYDTVMFNADAGVVFDGQEFSGDGIITITNGAIVIENTEDNVAVNGTALNDNITNTGDNVTISALGGNDTINSSGSGAMIDGGAGNNLVSIIGSAGSNIVFDGNTTVEGFKTGFGSGSDTLYINKGSDPGVDFKSDGLTFYDDNDSLTLDDVDDTAKVNLYYEASDTIARNVYIAQNDWYQVSNSDLNSGEGIYFVGTSATHNHGVDFSGVSQPLNVTMNTDYAATNNSIWVNNVYSIRGGAGNTTITGTDDSDTIIAGRGSATIDGAGGGDRISLGSAAALVKYTAGDGSDSIYGFNANSTISISGASYSSTKRGNNLILTVGSDNVTLFGAAALTNPNIIGTASSSSTTSGGGSSSTTSGGSSSSTTKGGDSSISGGDSSISGGGSSISGGGSSISGGGSSISGGGSSTSSVRGSSTSTTSSGSVDEVLTQLTGRRSSSTSGTSSTSTTSGSSSTSSVRGTSSTSSISTVSLTSTISGGSSTSSVRGSSTATISSTSTPDYVYTGGDAVITNYTPGEKIALGTPPTSGTFVDGNFVLTSASGNLVVENAANKVVEFTDGNGNAYIKAYAATNPSTIDGRGLAGFEIINGSEGNDFIYAGDGGSQLWGGSGTASDLLTGGAGTDIFVGGRYQGADIFNNAETKDEVHLNDATLSDIIATAEQNGLVAISFNTGNSVAIQSTEALSAAVILADGSKYRYNHATRNWQSA